MSPSPMNWSPSPMNLSPSPMNSSSSSVNSYHTTADVDAAGSTNAPHSSYTSPVHSARMAAVAANAVTRSGATSPGTPQIRRVKSEDASSFKIKKDASRGVPPSYTVTNQRQQPPVFYSSKPATHIYTDPSILPNDLPRIITPTPPLLPIVPKQRSAPPISSTWLSVPHLLNWRPPSSRPRVLFYHRHDPHYGFTNFSPHAVIYLGKRYPTSEHLFQSFKFENNSKLVERIRTCSERPSDAFSEARRLGQKVRSDWRNVNIQKMDLALWHKFTQHQDLQKELLATGDAELVEDSDKDDFWGIGRDGKGQNELGKALERLRSRLRSSPQVFTPVSSTVVGMCELCGTRPKNGRHPYCGKTCAEKACKYCHKTKKFPGYDFCSKTCGSLAGNQRSTTVITYRRSFAAP